MLEFLMAFFISTTGAAPTPTPALTINDGPPPNVSTWTSKGEIVADGSGWLVVDENDASEAALPYAAAQVNYVSLFCHKKQKSCALTEAIVKKMGSSNFMSSERDELKVSEWSEARVVAEQPRPCMSVRWIVDFKTKRVQIAAVVDGVRRTEMDACPAAVKFKAHLDTFKQAVEGFQKAQ